MSEAFKRFKYENGGCIAFYLLMLVTVPSLVFNILSYSDHNDKSAVVDTARISALCDSISYMNLWNATSAACAYDEADSLEDMHGEDIHTGVIKLATQDIEENSLVADSLMEEIHLMIKQTYK